MRSVACPVPPSAAVRSRIRRAQRVSGGLRLGQVPGHAEFGQHGRVAELVGGQRHRHHRHAAGQPLLTAAGPGVGDEGVGLAQDGQLRHPRVDLDVVGDRAEFGGVHELADLEHQVPAGQVAEGR